MIIIKDNILPKESLDSIVAATHQSGYGTWTPAVADLGHPSTPGMNWQGYHAPLHISIYNVMKEPIFPNHSFFKVSTKDDNISLIHSDRNDGDWTAIVYLSSHDYKSGTGFYRHKETGLNEMPEVKSMVDSGTVDQWNQSMREEDKWEQTDFVAGLYGRMVIFKAPLFHSRIPRLGQGESFEEGRIVWVCHFFTESNMNKEAR